MLPDELQHQQSGEGVNVYRTLFAGMAEGVVLQDVRGVVFACNPSAERILGFGKGEMIGGDSIDRARAPSIGMVNRSYANSIRRWLLCARARPAWA